jgi:hypothetical protein
VITLGISVVRFSNSLVNLGISTPFGITTHLSSLAPYSNCNFFAPGYNDMTFLACE